METNLQAFGIAKGELLDRTQLKSIEKGLQELFYGRGLYNAKVYAQAIDLPRNRVELRFDFIEGDPTEIVQINFTGNTFFSDEVLLDEMKLKDDVSWWDFFEDQQYQKQKVFLIQYNIQEQVLLLR